MRLRGFCSFILLINYKPPRNQFSASNAHRGKQIKKGGTSINEKEEN